MSDTKINVTITANNQAQSSIDQLVKGVQDLQAAFANVNVEAGKSDASAPLEKTTEAANDTAEAVQKTKKAHKEAGEAGEENLGVLKLLTEAYELLEGRVNSFLFGAQNAIKAIAAIELFKEINETAILADRINVLNTSLVVLAKNAGIVPADKLLETAEAIEKMGFDAASTRENLAKLVQVGIGVSFAEPLAKAAQDLSIIAGQTTSQTFTTLVQAVETGRTLMLRRLGIVVDEVAVVKKAESDYGIVLDDTAKKQVVLSAVLESASRVSGLYASSINTIQVQQQLLSLSIEDTEVALGQRLQPAAVAAISVFRQILDVYRDFTGGAKNLTEAQLALGLSQNDLNQQNSIASKIIHGVGDAIAGTLGFLREHATTVKAILAAYVAWNVIPSIVGLVVAAVAGIPAAVEGAIAAVTAFSVSLNGVAGSKFIVFLNSLFGVTTATTAATLGAAGAQNALAAAQDRAAIAAVAEATAEAGLGVATAGAGTAAAGAAASTGLLATVIGSSLVGVIASAGIAFGGLVAAALTLAAPVLAIAGAIAVAALGVYAFYKAIKGESEATDNAEKITDAYRASAAAIDAQTAAQNNLQNQSKFLAEAQKQLAVATQNGDEAAIEAATLRVEKINELIAGDQKALSLANENVKARALETSAAIDASKQTSEENEAIEAGTKLIKERTAAQVQSDRAREERAKKNRTVQLNTIGLDDETFDSGVDTKTTQQLDAVKSQFKGITDSSAQATLHATELTTVVENLAGTLKNQASLDVFTKDVDGFIEKLRAAGLKSLIPALQGAVQTAKDAVAKAVSDTNLGGAAAAAVDQEKFTQSLTASLDAVKARSDKAKDQVLTQQKQLDAAFAQGLIGIQDYYNQKQALEDADAATARTIAQAELGDISNRIAREATLANNEQKVRDLEIQFAEKEESIANAERSHQQTSLANTIARVEALKKLNVEREKSNADLLAQTGDTFGSQAELLRIDHAQTILQLETQIEQAKKRGNAEDAAAAKVAEDVQDRIYQLKLQSIAADQKLAEIGLQKSKLDQDDALASAQRQTYAITEQQYEDKLNASAQARVDAAKEELVVIQQKIQDEPLSIKNRTDEAQKITEITNLELKQQTQFRDTANAINASFQSQAETFLDELINQGKGLKQSLKDSISGFLQDVNKAIFKKAVTDFASGIGDIGGFITGDAKAGNTGGLGGFVNSIRGALGLEVGKDKPLDVPKPVATLDDDTKALIQQNILGQKDLVKIKGPAGTETDPYHVLVGNPPGAVNQAPGAPPITKDAADQQKSGTLVLPDGDNTPSTGAVSKNRLAQIGAANGLTPEQQALALAIYDKESTSGTNKAAFQPGVQGAVGAFQFLPATYRTASGGKDISTATAEEQADVFTKYIKKLSDQAGGSSKLGAAQFIGGEGAVQNGKIVNGDIADKLGTTRDQYAQKVADNAAKIQANATVVQASTDATKSDTSATEASKDASQAYTDSLIEQRKALETSTNNMPQAPADIVGPVTPTTDVPVDDGSNARDRLLARGDSTGGAVVGPAANTPSFDFSGVTKQLGSGLGTVLGGALGSKLGGSTGAGIGGLLGNLIGSNLGSIAKGLGSFFDKTKQDYTQGVASLNSVTSSGGSLGSFFTSLGDTISKAFSALSQAFSSGNYSGLLGSLGKLFGGSSSSAGDLGSAQASSVAEFESQGITVTGLAEGGPVSGAGTGTSDSIPAKLSHGEYVMTADKTAKYLPILEMMRTGKFDMRSLLGAMGGSHTFAPVSINAPRSGRYAEGGLVQSSAAAAAGGRNAAGTLAPVVNINIDASGNQKTGEGTGTPSSTSIDKFSKIMASVARQTIQDEQRPGGSLNPAAA